MNDQNLERELRSQRSPREEGYAPTRLPMTLEGDPAPHRGRSMLPRAALFTGVAVAGALAVAVVTGILSGSGPEVGGTNSTAPSAVASAATPGDCGPGDVTFAAEPWGGGAGSRGTVVTVSLADGRSPCMMSEGVTGTIQDADGSVLVSSLLLEVGGRSVLLEPGSDYTIGVAWSNWCGDAPGEPVSLSLRAPSWPAPVPVITPAGGIDPVPLCNGNGPSSLSLTYLQPQS